jgi:rfaE bifunctional protein kinase chain/domain
MLDTKFKQGQGYLKHIKESFPTDTLLKDIDSLSDLRVMVVGDLILDEYCYCRVAGTVSKWPVLSAIYQDIHQMVGAGAAIARHVKEFAQEVLYVSTVGGRDDSHAFAARLLEEEDIKCRWFTWPDTFTVTKRRYITGGYPNPLARDVHLGKREPDTRLFEIGFMPELPLPTTIETEICTYLEQIAPTYDLVILADFGHGMVSPRVAKTVAAHSQWWAVNAQTNSSNFGFNRITKYHKPDFVCIDELEARLPSGDKNRALKEIASELLQMTESRSMMITRGSAGLALFNSGAMLEAPALATTVVDPLGAGDAVLSMASLCRAKGIEDATTVFLSASTGAIASGTVGNDQPVQKAQLVSYVRDVLT